jgi:hypothetical protein
MLLTPQPKPAENSEAVTTLHVGPRVFAIDSGYETDRGVSNMPPIHMSVLLLADRTRGFVGSKALRLGGMKWRAPGCEFAERLLADMLSMTTCGYVVIFGA